MENNTTHLRQLLSFLEGHLSIDSQEYHNATIEQKIEHIQDALNSQTVYRLNENISKEINDIQEALFSYSKRDFSKKLTISENYDLLDALKLTINIHGEELEDLVELLHENNKLKDQFLANVSHEIRTPLNAIVGFASILLTTSLNPKQHKFVHSISKASDSLLSLVNDLLDFSRMQSKQVLLELVHFDFKESVEQLAQIYKYQATQKLLNFKLSIDPNIPNFLIGDELRLKQVLNNILANAIKFTETGEIELICKCIAQSEQSIKIRFEIKDSGIGIGKEEAKIIFERFRQANASTTRLYGGTGLGLTITREIVELMNGQIELESVKGQGTSMIIDIPFSKSEELKEQAPTTKQSTDFLFNKVLIVEDNVFNQLLAQNYLEGFSHSFDIANNGQEAINLLKQQNSYDIILLDIQMPIMDGYECTRIIREELNLNIPIVALTARSFNDEKKRCIDLGMDAFITKPYTQTILIDTIQKFRAIKQQL